MGNDKPTLSPFGSEVVVLGDPHQIPRRDLPPQPMILETVDDFAAPLWKQLQVAMLLIQVLLGAYVSHARNIYKAGRREAPSLRTPSPRGNSASKVTQMRINIARPVTVSP